MLVIKFHPYVKSEVDTKELQPSMTIESEENRQTENNKVSSFKGYTKKLDDIKRDEDKDERTKHELIQIPPTEKKKWPHKPCVYCRRKKVRRDTRYICSSCNAALCKDCFYNYHAKIKKYILI